MEPAPGLARGPYLGRGYSSDRGAYYTRGCSSGRGANFGRGFRYAHLGGQVLDEEQHTESYEKVADDIFDFAEKAQLFSCSSPYPTDCVIILKDDKEVHVQRGLLALHSEHFKELFAKDNRDRIALSTVDYDEFIEILCVIYPSGHPITARNIEALSKLAHQFRMADLLKRCDAFLMTNNSKLAKSKLLLIAQDYDLKRLLAHYVKEYKSIRDVEAVQDEPEYALLNYRTRRMLLDNIIKESSSLSASISYAVYDNDYAFYEDNAYGNNLASIAPAAKQTAFSESEILEALASSTFCPPSIILVVEDIHIQAHKEYLSVHSEYFNGMFQSEFIEGHENVVVLQEIGYVEMLELLSVVYPTEYPITDNNIGTILKLADRFIMPAILARCKKALKSTNTIKRELKLWYAQQYNFADLQEEFARQYKSVMELLQIKDKPEFEEFDNKTRALILDSIAERNRYR